MLMDFLILLIKVQQHFIVRYFCFVWLFYFILIFLGVENVKTTLIAAGFKELRENEQWDFKPSDKVKE